MNTLVCTLGLMLAGPPASALDCSESVAAKGEVKTGSALVHSFTLNNRGMGLLTITRVEASCGCLRRALSRTVLQPGDSATLTLDVNTLTQPAGPNRWQVVVGYRLEKPGSPPEMGEALLQMTATLKQEIAVAPPQLALSTAASANKPVSLVIVVTDIRAQPLTVLKAGVTSPHLSVELGVRRQGATGESRQELTITLAADAPAGQWDDVIVLTTNDPGYPDLRVPVRVSKRPAGEVIASPESVAVRFGANSDAIATLVQIRRADGKAVTIASAECDQSVVALKWSTGAAAVGAVRITVSELAAAQSGTAIVRVKLADPAAQSIDIPVRWEGMKK